MWEYFVVLTSDFGKHRITVMADDENDAVHKATCWLIAAIARGRVPVFHVDLTTDEGRTLLTNLGTAVRSVNFVG